MAFCLKLRLWCGVTTHHAAQPSQRGPAAGVTFRAVRQPSEAGIEQGEKERS
jgi:hypothetical protein